MGRSMPVSESVVVGKSPPDLVESRSGATFKASSAISMILV